MSYLLLFCRLSLLGLSVYGYLRRIGKHIRMEFAPGVLFTGICSVMFFAGILNILPETAWAVCAVGVVLAVQSLRRKESWKDFLCPGMFFFALSAAGLLILLRGRVLTDYDDFSHWGIVLKVIYSENRLPNFLDKMIGFQSYPTGSATFVYYFLTITGITSEWLQMYVQALLIAAVLTGLFAFAENTAGNLLTSAASIGFVFCNNGLFNLMVDSLLPIAALGGMALCHYYREQPGRKYYWLMPYLISLCAIKNSGVLFALFLLAYALLILRRQVKSVWAPLCASLPVTLLLWQKHVRLVFENGLATKHSMSAEGVSAGLLQKTPEQIRTIVEIFAQKVFSFTNPALFLLLLMLLVLLAAKLLRSNKRQDITVMVWFCTGFYLVYMGFLLATYLTTMPYAESVNLLSFPRYHRSILVFCCGCLLMALASCMRKGSKWQLEFTVCALCAALVYFTLFPGLWYTNPKPLGAVRNHYENLIAEYQIAPGKRYCVIMEQEPVPTYSGYLRLLGSYLLEPKVIHVYGTETFAQKDVNLQNYDYLIIFGESPELENFLLQTIGQDSGPVLYMPGS